MNRLGLHIQTPSGWETVHRVRPDILKVVSTALSVSNIQRWRAAMPDGILVYRMWFSDEELRPFDRVSAMLPELAQIREYVDYAEAPWNEASQRRGELGAYAQATVDAVHILHDAGYKVAVGNFSAGCPDLADWPLFYPALEVADALSLHEYDHPEMSSNAGWMCRRYRQVYAALPEHLRRPLLITECGIDDGAKHGWRTYADSAAHYAAQLRWYRDELEMDDFALGAAVFTVGSNSDWADYAIDGVAEVEALLQEQRPNVVITPQHTNEGGNNVAYAVGPGIETKMTEQKDEPASDEWYPLGKDWCLAWGKSGNLYCYLTLTNETHVFRPFV